MELDRGDGWSQLCAFLGRAEGPCAADSGAPFPHEPVEHASLAWGMQDQAFALHDMDNPITLTVDAENGEVGMRPWLPSRFAYVMLLCNPSLPGKRGYLVEALVAARSVRMTGTAHDVVLMVLGHIAAADVELLEREHVRVVPVQAVGSALPVNYEPYGEDIAAIYRTKARVFQFVEYEAAVFIDTDVMLLRNVDDFFHTGVQFLARAGLEAPLNTGFMVVKPSIQAMVDINDISLTHSFTPARGWMDHGPIPDWLHDNATADWSFYCASTDQGLFYFYFMCHQPTGAAQIVSRFDWHDRYVHFSGSNKPDKVTEIDLLPLQYREPAVTWLRILAKVEEMHGTLLDGAPDPLSVVTGIHDRDDRACMHRVALDSSRLACRRVPCAMEKANCVSSGAEYECTCKPPFYGDASSDGRRCAKFVKALNMDDKLRIGIGSFVNATAGMSMEACEAQCASTGCVLLAYSADHRCQTLHAVPRWLVPDPLGSIIAVLEVHPCGCDV